MSSWKRRLKIRATSFDTEVLVEIAVLKRGVLTTEEVSFMKAEIGASVMQGISKARYLCVPLVEQKVSGA